MGNKLDTKRFGMALGLTMGLSMLFLGVAASYFGWGTYVVLLLSDVYHGYAPTLIGSFVGAGWGMADGFVGGWLFAWFYNKCA